MPDNADERIQSPEELEKYIRVTSTGVWIVLIGIIIVLSGFAFWILTGSIETEGHEVISPISFVLK